MIKLINWALVKLSRFRGKRWNQCAACDRTAPCRHHVWADITGPVPPEERGWDESRWVL